MLNFIKTKKKWGSWSLASSENFTAILDFIRDRESYSVPFTSRLLASDHAPAAYMLGRNTVLIENSKETLSGAVLVSPDGIICPVFSNGCSTERLAEAVENASFFRKRFLTIMGKKENVIKLENLFTNKNRISVDYYHFTAESEQIPESVGSYLKAGRKQVPDIKIYKAYEDDIDYLMPLRKAYEIEEVVLNPAHFNESSCRKRFLDTIRTNSVLYAVYNDVPVATCCINAFGINWAQIGGVFTLPDYRSRGISASLMSAIAVTADEEKRDLTLFVKTDNPAAIKLYRNCGFSDAGRYRITYLESR